MAGLGLEGLKSRDTLARKGLLEAGEEFVLDLVVDVEKASLTVIQAAIEGGVGLEVVVETTDHEGAWDIRPVRRIGDDAGQVCKPLVIDHVAELAWETE